MTTSVIFPAFVNEYKGIEDQVITFYDNNFTNQIAHASEMLKIDLTGFDFRDNNFLHDELKSQFISYIYSCSVADILKKHEIRPSFVSGYSMGIYAALYYSNSLTFNEGLILVKHAWDIISKVSEGSEFGMGMIIGLGRPDILKMLHNKSDVEICNQNNRYTFIISGSKNTVDNVLLLARNEGAMRTLVIPASRPYHSHHLKSALSGFRKAIGGINFMPPLYKYVSAINQKVLGTSQSLKNEVVENLACRMNWLETMNYMINQGTNIFFECGAGDGLTRNTRFIEGEFQAFAVNKIEKFLTVAV